MKYMKNITLVAVIGTIPLLTGCSVEYIPVVGTIASIKKGQDMQSDEKIVQKRQEITTKFTQSPDTDTWNDQRKKLALASGDRVFDKDFGRVFDSLVVALGNLELTVKSMERTSGFISANGITLPPSEARQMSREAVNEWCNQNGYDSTILDKQLKTEEIRGMVTMLDSAGMMGKYEKAQKTLTFQLVKLGDNQTKVKLRFADVYYPGEVENYYKLVWQAVDKQIFVDQNIEGGVEKR